MSIVLPGGLLCLTFTERLVDWQLPDGARGTDSYDAVEVLPGTFFIDVWFQSRDDRVSLTIILDMKSGSALTVHTTARQPQTTSPIGFDHEFSTGHLHGFRVAAEALARPTRELLGQRLLSVYSPDVVFEHIYLNAGAVAWQCLRGWEPGANDTDEATYWRFGADLYVFAFRESAAQSSSVFLLDLERRRSTGKFHGLGEDGLLVNGALGATLEVLPRVNYPSGLEPV